MEHNHKFLATASSQAKGACPESLIDRFSSLPDEVAHCILSFLNFKELTRAGSVSKRCREFYLSSPSLEFRPGYGSNKQKQLQLLNSFDRFLIHRGDNKIQRFRIDGNFTKDLSDEIFRLITWIHIAVRCNVEVLDFKLNCNHMPETLELPSSIFHCASLRSLLMDFYTFTKAPSFAGFNNLQYLTLRHVGIDDGFCKWISSSCKCIKELQFDNVQAVNVVIESSSLESFRFKHSWQDFYHLTISGEKLVDVNIEWKFNSPGSRSLNIFAPNLKYFKWTGKLLNHHDLGKLMCLEKAEIFLKGKKPYEADDCDLADISEVLCSMCRVKVLILSEDTIKALFREGSMPAPFHDISYLSIHIWSLSDDLVPAMVSLLRAMPNLNTLCINTYPSLLGDKPKACGFNRKYWKSQNLAFVHQLKDVIIELSHGYNAVELAMYILEHAPNLKKMVIFYLPHQLYVIKKLNKSKKISSATVVFKKKRDERRIRSDTWRLLWYFLLG